MKLLNEMLDIILPRKCAGCEAPREVFCETCQASSYQKNAQCLFCGFRNHSGELCKECKKKFGTPLKKVLWAGRYDGELKKAIWALKYGRRKELSKPLGAMLAKKFLDINAELGSPTSRGSRTSGSASNFVIIPIPLHFKKEHERGFNQAELLAREFSKITGIEIKTNILEKIKETKAQVEVESKEARINNLEGAFLVDIQKFNNSTIQQLNHLAIILIDDVSTTGATLTHAARALANAGAKNILGLAVAHG